MLTEPDFQFEKETPGSLVIDEQQQEELPIYMAAAPFLFKAVVIEENKTAADGEDSVSVPWHWHNAFEINYVVSGKLRWSTPDSEYVLQKGEFCVMNLFLRSCIKPPPKLNH